MLSMITKQINLNRITITELYKHSVIRHTYINIEFESD
jgi:hypothetical protein